MSIHYIGRGGGGGGGSLVMVVVVAVLDLFSIIPYS